MRSILGMRLFFSTAILMNCAQGAIEIPRSATSWEFTPPDTLVAYPISLDSPVSRQLERSTPCCKGTYTVKIQKSAFVDQPGTGLSSNYILLPQIIGLREVRVNDSLVLTTKNDYSSAGPIVPLGSFDIESPVLKISYFAETPVGFHAGPWLQSFYIGTADEVFEMRERRLILQRYFPLAISLSLFLVALAILSSGLFRGPGKQLYAQFLYGLVAWSFFYLSLSGVPRGWHVGFATLFHLPLRAIAGLTFVRLLLFIVDASKKIILVSTIFGLLVIGVCLALNSFTSGNSQVVGYFLMGLLFDTTAVYFLFRISKRKLGSFELVVVLATLIMLVGSNSDLVKVLGFYFFDYNHKLPFLNRFTDAPLILTSLYYLVDETAKSLKREMRADATDSLREQLLHDLRSPVSALKVSMRSLEFKKIDADELTLIRSAANRIYEMCETLKFDSGTDVRSTFDAVQVVRSIVEEKSIEVGKDVFNFSSDQSSLFILANPGLFERVIHNLINNALEASGDVPEIKIEISVSDRQEIQILITDRGHGISSDDQKNVFEKYFSKGKRGGRGLGLYGARKNIELWGGEIALRSGQSGTTITLSLPVITSSGN